MKLSQSRQRTEVNIAYWFLKYIIYYTCIALIGACNFWLLHLISLVIIMILSRLVYRKGVDLLAGIMPIICNKYPFVCTEIYNSNNWRIFEYGVTILNVCLNVGRFLHWRRRTQKACHWRGPWRAWRSDTALWAYRPLWRTKLSGSRSYFPQCLPHGSLLHGYCWGSGFGTPSRVYLCRRYPWSPSTWTNIPGEANHKR